MDSFNENEWVVIGHNREIIGTIMHGYVGIRRSRRLSNTPSRAWKISITKSITFINTMPCAER